MATYLMLERYTQKGIENIQRSPAQLDEAKKASKAVGAQIKEFYLVMGRYDIVFQVLKSYYPTIISTIVYPSERLSVLARYSQV